MWHRLRGKIGHVICEIKKTRIGFIYETYELTIVKIFEEHK